MSSSGTEGQESLTERYKLTDQDDDSKNWVSLLDFETPVKVESDWYSTQTFQVFLDALDISQPTTLGRETSNSNLSSATTSKSSSDDSKQKANDKKPTTSGETRSQKQSNNFETILSAEALKILSELPDLSHMSATRSFIFPSNRTTTSTGKR